MKEKDLKHLEWVYERMKIVHNENENLDYMIRFREIIEGLKKSDNITYTEEQNDRMREWFKERTGLEDVLLFEHMKKIDERLNHNNAIPRCVPNDLYDKIQEEKTKRYGNNLFENIEEKANYSHGQCDTIDVIEKWLSEL